MVLTEAHHPLGSDLADSSESSTGRLHRLPGTPVLTLIPRITQLISRSAEIPHWTVSSTGLGSKWLKPSLLYAGVPRAQVWHVGGISEHR